MTFHVRWSVNTAMAQISKTMFYFPGRIFDSNRNERPSDEALHLNLYSALSYGKHATMDIYDALGGTATCIPDLGETHTLITLWRQCRILQCEDGDLHWIWWKNENIRFITGNPNQPAANCHPATCHKLKNAKCGHAVNKYSYFRVWEKALASLWKLY